MMTSMITDYRTLYRIGLWASLDVRCKTTGPDEYGILTYAAEFMLIGKYGDRCSMEWAICSPYDMTSEEVHDEDSTSYPDFGTVLRTRAAELAAVTPMEGRRMAIPPRHETWGRQFRRCLRMNVLGIDPGLSGGLAIVNEQGAVLLVDDLPVHQVTNGKKTKLELDVSTLRQILTSHPVDHVVLERVAARPGQGVCALNETAPR
jgi:hypothetical protein